METCLDALTEKLTDLTNLIQLRAPPDADSKPPPAVVARIDQSLDEIERRVKASRRTIDSERKMLEEERELILEELERTRVGLMNMLENLPRHLPKAKFVEKKDAVDVQEVVGNGERVEGTTTMVAKNPLQPSNIMNIPKAFAGKGHSASPEHVKPETMPEAKKMSLSVLPITVTEFEAIPKYVLNRVSRDKLNDLISEFNKITLEKYATLKIPQAKMSKPQRERFWDHKKLITEETKGKAFITESDVKENWA
ncbi:Spindle and kinetochore-associated protein 1, partial [Dinochytrium kinnereticum]